ncbi:MAG TPA: DUF2150 family protein [Candidatus Bathyarchaeia archaeon]|nr:DUF2150 family protein [Candidatus Bathyarchaeia archaeon]
MKNAKNLYVPFTQERWRNWIDHASQSDYKSMDESTTAVFVEMEEDVIIACCKVVRGFELGKLTREESLDGLQNIEGITQEKVDTGDPDLDDLVALIQSSLIGAFASFESYVKASFADKASMDELIREALDQEKKGHFDLALAIVGKVGARVIAGEPLQQEALAELEDSYVAEWLDGVDSISAAIASSIEFDSGEEAT